MRMRTKKKSVKKKRKGGGGKRKGGSFEREIAIQLSLWWTDQKRDDVFWRTASSGGRATIRGRKNKKTAGSNGDICALDPIGQPLMEFCTFEVKRGYNRVSPFDMLDQTESSKKPTWLEWINQAQLSQNNAKSKHWAIIARRDKRDAVIMMPFLMAEDLELHVRFDSLSHIVQYIRVDKGIIPDIVTMRLSDFFEYAQRDWIIAGDTYE